MARCAASLNLYGSCGCGGGRGGGSTWAPGGPACWQGGVLGRASRRPTYQAVQVVVVPHEGVEGPQLGPAHAQLLRGVVLEAADVGPDQGDPQQVEEQDLCGGRRADEAQAAGPARSGPRSRRRVC